MEKKEIVVKELNKVTIESMVYEIRGQKVMLDFELAEIYGYETKNFNRQVKNNIEKFPIEFRFQLNKEEVDDLVRCKNFTSRSWEHNNDGGRRYLPYAFTEQGIYMLMTVLKGDLATRQSIALVKAFKQMKDYVISTNNLLPSCEIVKLVDLINNHSNRLDNIENQLNVVMENFIDPSTYNHFLFMDGERFEADMAYQKIYSMAKKSIYIIDDYIDIKTLQLFRAVRPKVEIIIFTANKGKNCITRELLEDFKGETNIKISIKSNGNKYHDRYIILDYKTKNETMYHCGASSKDAGNKISTIDKIVPLEDYLPVIDELLKNKDIDF